MESTRYWYKIDLENLNSSHSLAVLSVAPGSRVLDLGAADGSVARALKQRHCTVWGIERDERAAAEARDICDRVVVADLETASTWQALGDETFDVVLALDVLEHLREPAAVLRRAAGYLKPDGIVVVSVPNVTHGAVRLSLLQGRFEYTDVGLLDRTHLRFFDRRGAERLMRDAGLTVSEHLRVTRQLEDTEIAIERGEVTADLLQTIARDPDATTYQFVFVGRRAEERSLPTSARMLSERLLADNEGIRAQFQQVEQYAKQLEAEVGQYVKRLEADRAEAQVHLSQLPELRAQLEQQAEASQQQDRTLRQAIADKEAVVEDLRRELQTKESLIEELRNDPRLHELDELRSELRQRVEESQRQRIEIRHAKADLLVKQAYIDTLRGELQDSSASPGRDDRARPADVSHSKSNLLADDADLETAWADLRQRNEQLEAELHALRIYANSAAFRLTDNMIIRMKRLPVLFNPARAIVRKFAGPRGEGD